MEIHTIVILATNSLQSCLIKQQLSTIKNVNIDTCLPEHFVSLSSSIRIDLVIIDYLYLNELLQSNTLPDFNLLSINLLVHNVPDAAQAFTFVRLKCLKGLLLQSASIEHLTQGVRYILKGGLWLPRKCLEQTVTFYREPYVLHNAYYETLTCREKQILDLIYHGKSNQEIANQLFVTESTVKSHVYKLYKKLHVHKRREAAQIVKGMNNSVGPHSN